MMRITELLTKETINLSLTSSTKTGAIEELVSVLDNAGKLNDRSEYKKAIIKREEQSTTGIGEGIAIPHAKTNAVKHAAIAFGRSKAGVNYESLDGQPSHLFFMIAATEGANNTHLEALSRLSTILLKDEVRKKLLEAGTADEVLNIIKKKKKKNNLWLAKSNLSLR
jgi:fructose PTS system EIIBC or EIIC component